MSKDMPWREAIIQVLQESESALHYTQIADQIIARGLRKSVGATPSATVNANISSSLKYDTDSSPFLRAGPGQYMLLAKVNENNAPKDQEQDEAAEESQYDIITSFGMFWRRDLISWIAKPKLLGLQQLGATPVDFNPQFGIYLLYDGREIIYVGRSTERPLGRRLYEHTLDRLATRWDRFSWFGLLPIAENGDLGTLPPDYQSVKMIPALEAVLIEALEPRQNRRRGDDLSAVEYIQESDPEVARKQQRQLLERMKSALEKDS